MLRATIYIRSIVDNELKEYRSIKSYPVTNTFDFEVRATRDHPGAELSYGPIAPPWSKL